MPTPKITIDNFGLIGQGATHWLENFDISEIGSKKVLSTSWNNIAQFDNDDTYGTGFTNLTNILAFSDWIDDTGNSFITGFTGDKIFMFSNSSVSTSKGEIHDQTSSGTGVNQVLASSYPDIYVTKEGNILYTNAHHIGIGWYGTCAAGSSTTQIVDADGRDIDTTLGVLNTGSSSTAPSKYVYNISNRVRYEITGKATTNSTDDTMTFSAGTANDTGDEFIVFVDNGWTGSDNYEFNVSNVRDNHFKGQESPSNWRRQIALFGDDYVITNGNYLATLNVNLTTFAREAKRLPYATQAMCTSVNNGKIITGAKRNNKGILLLWDGYTSGWNSEVNTDLPVYSIQEYRDGWIALIGNSLYFTNGYDKSKLTDLPDYGLYTDAPEYHFNQMKIIDDNVFVVGNKYSNKRVRHGVYVYNLTRKGWTFIPFVDKNTEYDYYNTNQTALHSFRSGVTNGYFLYNSTSNSINYIYKDGSFVKNSVAMLYVKLPEKMRLSEVELNISFKNIIEEQLLDDTANTLYVSYGDGRKPMWTSTTISGDSTVSSLVNTQGDNYPATVGQQVLVVDGSNAFAGERTWITGITNAGTATETLAINPSLSVDVTDTTNISIIDLKKSNGITITYDSNIDFLQTLRYNLNDFFSDKLYLEIYLKGSTVYPIDIHSINIY